MKKTFLILLILIFGITGCNNESGKQEYNRVKIIFDTDLGPDYDDVGALAFLHAMADSGKAEILATIASNKHQLVAPCIEVINTYFGRADLPIGAPKRKGISMSASQHWPDSLAAGFYHSIRSTGDVPDAVNIYRKILASQPDNSVTIITVGFLTNIADLLRSESDTLSQLTGIDLVSKKVKLLVSMAGGFPEGREFNIFKDSVSSGFTFNNWPGEVIFTGFEIGRELLTGSRLIASDIKKSPVKEVFRISMPLSKEDKNGRMSWDQTAVLIGVYGTDGFFDTKRGTIIIKPDGSNKWEDDPRGKHKYVIQKMPVPEMTRFIEDRMMHVPATTPKPLKWD